MKLQDYKKQWEKVYIEYKGIKAIEAVKQNGYALQYVKDQTETICLEAVKQNCYALQYVNASFFYTQRVRITLSKQDIAAKFGVNVDDIEIITNEAAK